MKIKIGTVTLKQKHQFTQYGEHAAWTDYVTCEPQTVDLFRYDDGYWIGAKFEGILTASTYPTGSRQVGKPAGAFIQTQSWGGIGGWIESDLFHAELTNPTFALKQVGTYGDGCGESTGKPMVAIIKQEVA